MENKVIEIHNELITIAMRGVTVLPKMSIYLDMKRDMSIAAASEAQRNSYQIFLTAQKDDSIENPTGEQLEEYGVIAKVKQIIREPEGRVRVLVNAIEAAQLVNVVQYVPYMISETVIVQSEQLPQEEQHQEAMLRLLKEKTALYKNVKTSASDELYTLLEQQLDLDMFSSLLACSLPMKQKKRQEYLEVYSDIDKRCEFLAEWLNNEAQVEEFKKNYQLKLKKTIDKQQKDYILREQLKLIKEELGEGKDNYIEKYERQLAELDASDEVKEQITKEIRKLKGANFAGAEIAVCQNYIETLLDIPWEKKTEENLSVSDAEKILDKDHYGLEDVKKKILEFLAVYSLKKKETGDESRESRMGHIICLFGPPGTGKTSIARSIAKALNREYVRISLGGIRDEAEIRGHRRTYVAAMPGRIVQSIKKSGVRNPLILLDEIDKISSDTLHGDVASAMLEVLDGEQNFSFTDHYLELPLNLSDVFFIATANTLDTIPAPLRDRMEVIEISGYTRNEKFEIAKKFLLPKQIKENALPKQLIEMEDSVFFDIIDGYTKEAGVRSLERQIASVCRKAALEYIDKQCDSIYVNSSRVKEYLGKRKYSEEKIYKEPQIGIVRGLAWTSVGGTTLEIEVNTARGKGAIQLTGKLGDVMKESAQTALSYVRSISDKYNVESDFFDKTDIHIHVPEGAVPKDGPSAGITMASAILSAVTGRKVKNDIAMTGEVTLRGRVLPIGGLKEKLLAAKQAGVKTVLIPYENESDIETMNNEVTDDINIIPVKSMDEVIEQIFV